MVAIALLLMTSAISLEKALGLLARGFVTVLVLAWAICIVRELIAAALPALAVAAHWIRTLALATAVVALVVLAAAGVARWVPHRRNRKRGEHELDRP